MSSEEIFDRARNSGFTLGTSDARVLLHPETAQGHRVWLGTDLHGHSVAYFEILGRALPSFQVSQVISVEAVDITIYEPLEEVRVAKVACRDPELNGVFSVFMDDIVEQLGTKDPVTALLDSASTWRRLLRAAQSRISEPLAMGIYGELRFLEDLVANLGPQSIDMWQISGHDIQDFIGDRIRVEVKASAFQNRQEVSIHGLKQLELPAGSRLTLAVAEIQRHGAGESIADVVSRLLASGTNHETLIHKLGQAGYVRGMLSPNAEPTFSLLSWRFWDIGKDSPVLSESTVGFGVASSISNVSYSLSLVALGESASNLDWHQFQPDPTIES